MRRIGRGKAVSGKLKISLITMDSIDEHWLKVKAGAEKKAAEPGSVALTFVRLQERWMQMRSCSCPTKNIANYNQRLP